MSHKDRLVFGSHLDEIVKDTVLMVTGLSDPYTKEHCIMVAELAGGIARRLGLTAKEVHRIKLAGYLHDIGKQAIPHVLITKPGKLSAQEFELVKTHVLVGVNMLEKLNVSADIIRMVGEHHERLDGSGYPMGIRGEEISYGGQIIGIADVVSALITKRTYRTASTNEEVAEILLSMTPHKMQKDIVLAAIECLETEVEALTSLTDYVREVQNSVLNYH